jgi:hypothetical protein
MIESRVGIATSAQTYKKKINLLNKGLNNNQPKKFPPFIDPKGQQSKFKKLNLTKTVRIKDSDHYNIMV